MCVIMFSGNYPGGKLFDLAIENKYENLQSSQLSTSNKIELRIIKSTYTSKNRLRSSRFSSQMSFNMFDYSVSFHMIIHAKLRWHGTPPCYDVHVHLIKINKNQDNGIIFFFS